MKLQITTALQIHSCLLHFILTLRRFPTDLHISVEEAVFVHEGQALQHLVHDVADHRLRQNLVSAADGGHSAEPAPVPKSGRGLMPISLPYCQYGL